MACACCIARSAAEYCSMIFLICSKGSRGRSMFILIQIAFQLVPTSVGPLNSSRVHLWLISVIHDRCAKVNFGQANCLLRT